MQDDAQQRYAYDILAANFTGQDTAQEMLKAMKSSGVLEPYLITAQAVVEQDPAGKVHVHTPGHGVFGAAGGAALGGLLGLLGGPVGVLTLGVAGAAIGGAAGHVWGRVVPKEDLAELAQHLAPDSSALLLLIEASDSDDLRDRLQGYSDQVVRLRVGEELAQELADFAASAE